MNPIYWTPVQDVAFVVRGTWFYKDTMYPVEAEVADQIEKGYEYIKPWTQTYAEEINICLEIGPEAELKLVHRLWPEGEKPAMGSRPTTSKGRHPPTEKPFPKMADLILEKPSSRAAGTFDFPDEAERLFGKSSVMYSDHKNAQILLPYQLPSVARGRKPLASLRKGHPIGLEVVRGFDQFLWEKLHPPRGKIVISSRSENAFSSRGSDFTKSPPCEACIPTEERPKTSDLILVIHG